MPHRDVLDDITLNVSLLKEVLLWLLSSCDFSAICWKSQCTWSPRLLASVAMLWVWSDESTLTERFDNSRKIGLEMEPVSNRVAGSYQAFMKLLIHWSRPLLVAIQIAFRGRMQTESHEHWWTEGLVMFGVDGSKIALPRTRDLEASCAPSRKPSTRRRNNSKSRAARRKASNPQLLLTTLWHAGTGLVWDWRTGPSDESERHHLLEMLEDLPQDALVTADAGFVGYEFLSAIVGSGRHFLIRIGANVKLLQELGFAREYHHTVSLWPDKQARRNQSPLVLRIAAFHRGKETMSVLTSLPKSEANDAKLLRLYRRRWGIEVYYRQLKETFDRRKLKSRSTSAAHVELEWSLAGLWAMSLYALPQILASGYEPARMSCANVLRAFRRIIRDWLHPLDEQATLKVRLASAVIDAYARSSKTSRGTPRKRTVKPPGIPSILPASDSQKLAAKQLRKANSKQG